MGQVAAAAADRRGERGGSQKTRTPHRDVGNYVYIHYICFDIFIVIIMVVCHEKCNYIYKIYYKYLLICWLM